MNSLNIIGNITRDPELRTTTSGASVCTFTVAVNRKKKQQNNQPEADFFRVSAWNQLGENCAKYLTKGKKVAVIGSVSVSTYQGHDGKTYANMNVFANEIEFLSPKGETATTHQEETTVVDPQTGMMAVNDDDLPF